MKKEKIFNILLFVLIFISILSSLLPVELNNLDEIWQYTFARNIGNGLVPYKEISITSTPLISMIAGLILKLTFDELIVMRILAAVLCSVVIYTVYKLFKLLNIKTEISFLFTFLIGWLLLGKYCIDYNFGTLLLILIIIYKEIESYKKDKVFLKSNIKLDIFLGFLAGLCITTKQTSGLFTCLALLGNKLLFVTNKEEFKIYIKSCVYRIIGIIIPVLAFIIYLISNNAFDAFINYSILGISEFTNTIPYTFLFKWNIVGVLSILVPLTFVYTVIETVFFEKDKFSYIFCVYGLAMFVICFPISDPIHFLVGALPTIILILYKLYNLLKKIFAKNERNKLIINETVVYLLIVIVITLICFSVINLVKYFKSRDTYSQNMHFKLIPISSYLETRINEVAEYLRKNENTKILNGDAVVYMIAVDRYNKDYDMLGKGSLGANGANRIIEEISNTENIKYLVAKKGIPIQWQMQTEVLDFIKNNKTKVGEVSIFDIYE